jgi:hypothetical protein
VVRLPENRNDPAGNWVGSGNHKAGSLLVSSIPAGPDIAQEARRRRDRIKLLLTSMTEQTNKVAAILEEAQTNEDHLTLGYKSWTAYIAGEYTGLLAELNRAQRRVAVGELTAAGMSTRAIASVVGTSQKTVVKDLQVIPEVSPGDDLAYSFECGSRCWHSPICQRVKKTPQKITETKCDVEGHEDHVDREDVLDVALGGLRTFLDEHPVPTDRKVTGMDGKLYPVPSRPVIEPKKPRRGSLPDQYLNASHDLDKALRRLEKLHADDRFMTNRKTLNELHSLRFSDMQILLGSIEMDLAGTNTCHVCDERVQPGLDFGAILTMCKTCAGGA